MSNYLYTINLSIITENFKKNNSLLNDSMGSIDTKVSQGIFFILMHTVSKHYSDSVSWVQPAELILKKT